MIEPAGGPVLIESLGVYLPAKAVSTQEVVNGCARTLSLRLERVSGIRSRRVAADDEFSIDLAFAAIADCLRHSRYDSDAIDLLIYTSISHFDARDRLHSYEPAAALRLKARCGFHRAIAFDLSNGCAGLWTGILIARSMIARGVIERAMVVTGEYLTSVIASAQQEIRGLFDGQVASLTVGDAGAAVLLDVGDDPAIGFQSIDLYTMGRYSDYCVVGPSTAEHGGPVMMTDSIRIGARSVEHAVPHLITALGTAGWSGSGTHLVPHQTSETTLLDGFKRINARLENDSFEDDRYHLNLRDRANTGTASHIVALKDSIDSGRIRSGDRAAFGITGSGLSIGTALYTFDDLPDRLRNGGDRGAKRPATPGGRSSQPRRPVAALTGVSVVRGAEAAALETTDLCQRAASECLQRSRRSAGDVDVVIHSGVYRSGFLIEPAIAAIVAGELGINAAPVPGSARTTLAFDITAGHLGTLKALWTAEGMIRAGTCTRALVIASDVENNAASPQHGLYGLEPSGSAMLIELGTEGPLFELFHFRDFPEHIEELRTYCFNPDGHPRLVAQRHPEFAAHARSCLAVTVREMLALAGLSPGDFDAVIPPAALPDIDLGFPEGRMVRIVPQGDLVSSSVAAGMRALEDDPRIGPGARVLILEAGAGIQTGCALVRFV